MSVIYLIRHGQASFGEAEYDRLSELGRTQSNFLGDAMLNRQERVDRVVTGTMQRQRETAQVCMGRWELRGAPKPIVDPAFNEYDHNDVLAGLDARFRDREAIIADMAKSDNPGKAFEDTFTRAVERWVRGEHDGDYAETWTAFVARCRDGLDRLAADLAREHVAFVFTSGGPIGVIVSTLMGLDPARMFAFQWRLYNAGVSKILAGRGGLALASFNEHWHLDLDIFRHANQNLLTYR